MRRTIARALALLASIALANPTLAYLPSALGNLQQYNAGSFQGPGSRGYLPYCQNVMTSRNNLEYSNNFAGSTWHTATAGNFTAAPTVTASQTDPLGGTTAYSVAFNGTNASGASSTSENVLYYSVNPGGNGGNLYNYGLPNIVDGWIKGPAGSAVFLTYVINSTTFQEELIQFTGKWQYFTFVFNASAVLATNYIELGWDLRDPVQLAYAGGAGASHQVAAVTVSGLWRWMMSPGATPLPYGGDTTTSNLITSVTSSCPPGLAFRDWSQITPYGARPTGGSLGAYGASPNPVDIAENQGGATGGGVSGPYLPWNVTPDPTTGLYSTMMNCSPNLTGFSGTYWNQCVATASSLTGQWTVGSAAISITNTSTWPSTYMLHGALVPGGCNVGGTSYSTCEYISASGSPSAVNTSAIALYAGNSGISGLSSANQIGGAGATVFNSASMAYEDSTDGWASVFQSYDNNMAWKDPSLPGIVAIGAGGGNGPQYNILVHAIGDNASYMTEARWSPYGSGGANNGYAWNILSPALPAHNALGTDWDFLTSGQQYARIDPNLFVPAHCGFVGGNGCLEYMFTSFYPGSTYQYIGTAVGSYSINPANISEPILLGPFYVLNSVNGLAAVSPNFTGGVLPAAGPLCSSCLFGTVYGPTIAVGDSTVVRSNGKLYYFSNAGSTTRSPGTFEVGRDF